LTNEKKSAIIAVVKHTAIIANRKKLKTSKKQQKLK